MRRNYLITLGLLLPGLLTGIHLLYKGMTFTPRFFLYELFLALLAAVALLVFIGRTIEAQLRFAGRRPGWLETLLIFILILASAASLIRYYQVPKQSYRAAVRSLNEIKQPGQAVVIFYLAELGIRYYSDSLNGSSGAEDDYYFLSSEEELSKVLETYGVENVYIVTTLYRYIRLEYPNLDQMLTNDWEQLRIFPATIGGGEIEIWQARNRQS